MRRLLRYIYHSLLPARLRQYADIFQNIRPGFHQPILIDKPEGRKVLVISPHPDDEILGCGGTLVKHSLAKDQITVVYMTDGRKGCNGTMSEEQFVMVRHEEAAQAGKVIGIKNQIFLKNRDMELKKNLETVSQLRGIINDIAPDIVYLPFFMDYHTDHQATNDIFIAAVNGIGRDFMCYAYEIWTPFIPNCIVDVTLYTDMKIEALNKFESQVKRFNAVGACLGLMKYRSVLHSDNDGYAECFFRSSVKEYVRLWKIFQ